MKHSHDSVIQRIVPYECRLYFGKYAESESDHGDSEIQNLRTRTAVGYCDGKVTEYNLIDLEGHTRVRS